MRAKKDGGPAFPIAETVVGENYFTPDKIGMSLRDYFAAAALQGLIASSHSIESFEAYSQCAFHHADAMLAAREK